MDTDITTVTSVPFGSDSAGDLFMNLLLIRMEDCLLKEPYSLNYILNNKHFDKDTAPTHLFPKAVQEMLRNSNE